MTKENGGGKDDQTTSPPSTPKKAPETQQLGEIFGSPARAVKSPESRKRPVLNKVQSLDLSFLQAPPQPPTTSVDDREALDKVDAVVSEENFTNELMQSFFEAFYKNDGKTKIDQLSIHKHGSAPGEVSKGVNSNNHFIITNDRTKERFHIKAALHGVGISNGSKFIEAAFYRLNEILRIGPRSNAVLVQGSESKSSLLMIVTEDLAMRGASEEKEVTFSDNSLGSHGKKPIIDQIPIKDESNKNDHSFKENIHRCKIEIAAILCSLSDIEQNYGNTGFKQSTKNKVIKLKPFIVDLRVSHLEDLRQRHLAIHGQLPDFSLSAEDLKILESKNLANQIGVGFVDEDKFKDVRKAIFEFSKDSKTFKETLKTLFLGKDARLTKFHDAIEKSFEFAKDLANKSHSKSEKAHLVTLETIKQQTIASIDIFLANEQIKDFLESESKKMKQELDESQLREGGKKRKTPRSSPQLDSKRQKTPKSEGPQPQI